MKKVMSVTALLLLASVTSFACEKPEPKTLHLIYPEKSSLDDPVTVQFALDKNIFHAHFEIHTPDINAKQNLAANEYPYQWDVVEVFISAEKIDSGRLPLPYYEFEVSPLNQTLQVKIIDTKHLNNNIMGIDMGLKSFVRKISNGWTADMFIPLDKLGWNGDPSNIVGNAYAVLGKPPRTFWNLFIPPQKRPDFHLPEYFKPLVPCKTPAEHNE